jgi:hypothetical protein
MEAKAKAEDDGAGAAADDADDDDDDHEAWALRPEWELGSQPGVWEKWTDYGWGAWANWKEAKDEGGGADDGAADAADDEGKDGDDGEEKKEEDEETEGEDDYPSWAQNHKKNNDRKEGTRGKYIVRDGEALFKANEANGGMAYEAGMGRKRGRTRGKGSVVRHKGKAKDKKDKGKKGPEKGKGKGKGKGKNKDQEYLCRSFALAESAMSGQNKLIDLLVHKETSSGQALQQPLKTEVKDEWGWGNSSGDGDGWWSRGSSSSKQW